MSVVTPDIEATYRIVTPAFIGGADPKTTAELRLPSIKGTLRFWWRTLALVRIGNNVQKLWKEESELFGSADKSIGQSKVMMKFKESPTAPVIPLKVANGNPTVLTTEAKLEISGAAYLGYGVIETARNRQRNITPGQLIRPAINKNAEFTVQLRFRSNVSSTAIREVKDALCLIGCVGGIGSRSRRGWGSVTLTRLVDNQKVEQFDDLRARLAQILSTYATEVYNTDDPPAWTRWTNISRIVVAKANPRNGQAPTVDAIELLNTIGTEMVQFRSCGHNTNGGRTTLVNKPVEMIGPRPAPRFWDDHDLMIVTAPDRRTHHPRRVAFGLPHNYGGSLDRKVGPSADRIDRRPPGSPHTDRFLSA